MNAGQGSISPQGLQVVSSFATGAANNGLSVDPTTKKIVLGNDSGDPAKPAQLLSTRSIFMNGQGIQLEDTNLLAFLQSNAIGVSETANGNTIQMTVANIGSELGIITGAGATIKPRINFDDANSANQFLLSNINGQMVLNNVATGQDFFFAGMNGIKTRAPLGSAGQWLLGDVVVAASVLDGTQYLEVKVSGVVYKLALIV